MVPIFIDNKNANKNNKILFIPHLTIMKKFYTYCAWKFYGEIVISYVAGVGGI